MTMNTAPAILRACPRCGRPQPEQLLVGGLCPACVARGVHGDLLTPGAEDEGRLEEKEPVSIQVQGYEILDLVGGGAMGEVYRAVLNANGREVALKMLAGRLTRDPEVVARFAQAVKVQARLDHPNIVQVMDLDEMANGRHVLITEYVSGCDLQRLLRAERLETERAVDIFLKVCAGVADAHKHGVMHRDIKPANVIVGKEGVVKVAVRPEAWHIGPPGTGLGARLAKLAYLGSNYEYTFDTELGPIFVVSADLGRVLDIGSDVGLGLADHGVSVVQVS